MIGDVTKASAELGRRLWNEVISTTAAIFRDATNRGWIQHVGCVGDYLWKIVHGLTVRFVLRRRSHQGLAGAAGLYVGYGQDAV